MILLFIYTPSYSNDIIKLKSILSWGVILLIKDIKQIVIAIVDKAAKAGVSPNNNSGVPTQISYLVNLFSLILSTTMFIVGTSGFFINISHTFLNISRIALSIIYIVPILLNYLGKYRIARFYMVFMPPFMLFMLCYLAGVPEVHSIRSAMLPAFVLPITLYGLKFPKRMLLGFAYIIGIMYLLEPAAKVGGIVPNLPLDLYSSKQELNLNIQLNIGLMLNAVLFYQYLLFLSEKDLVLEQHRSERLLQSILPAEIIPTLKESPEIIADYFHETSILFADIADFTSRAEKMDAADVVTLLNEVFTYFDSLTDKYGIEKIKTIGDCYMAASGVPHKRNDHAVVLVKMAMEAQKYINETLFHNEKINLRIGISSGSVVAGVIGRKKFIYDLWGDTVNTASRMESQGEIGTIQITEDTKILVENSFECKKLGSIDIKGKGIMPVYQVIREI